MTDDRQQRTDGIAPRISLWALVDRLAVPRLGLAEGSTSSPPELHAYTLGRISLVGWQLRGSRRRWAT